MPDPKFLKPWHGIPRKQINWHPTVDEDKCIGCATCVTGCNRLVYRYDFEKEKAIVYDPLNCLVGCTTCHNTCPVDAISFPPFEIVFALEKRVDEHHSIEDDLLNRRDILKYKEAKLTKKSEPIVKYKEHRGDMTILRIELDENTTAGKHYSLMPIDKNWLGRVYSISNVPLHDGYVEFHIKKVDGGRFSEYVYNDIDIGDKLLEKGPFGSFACNSPSSRKLFFVALGVGLAPLIGMAQEALLQDPNRDITLFWGVSKSKDFYYIDEIIKLSQKYKNFKTIFAAKEYNTAIKLPKHGEFLKKRSLEAFIEGSYDNEHDYYIAGPFDAINTFLNVLIQKGINKNNIFTEI